MRKRDTRPREYEKKARVQEYQRPGILMIDELLNFVG